MLQGGVSLIDSSFPDRTYSLPVCITVHPSFRVLVDDDDDHSFIAYLVTDMIRCADHTDAAAIATNGVLVSSLGYDEENQSFVSTDGGTYDTVQAWANSLPEEFLTTMFDDLQEQAKERLQALMNRLTGVRPVKTHTMRFTVSDVINSHSRLIAAVEKATEKKLPYIYCLTVAESDHLEAIWERYYQEKEQSLDRKYAQLNPYRSCCFYVGSSHDFRKRLKEHLGYGNPKTYSLQLAHWAQDFSTLELTLECDQYDAALGQDVLQALEDTLWDNMRPMFGRKGSK
jgi:hypothetical protein